MGVSGENAYQEICIPASEDQTRDCFISEAHIAERGSDTESMSAWIEDAKAEVDRDMEFPEDTVSETSWDIGFPPPIPQRTKNMFLAQSFDPSDHTTVQIPMIPNTSYTKFEPPEALRENGFVWVCICYFDDQLAIIVLAHFAM